METIRQLIKANIPTSIMAPIIQCILSLPPSISRYLIADFTAPKKSQMSWIKMMETPTWKGAWIGPSIAKYQDDDLLLQRIKDADMIIYKVHGGAFRVGHCTMYMDVFQNWIHLLKENHNINALILSIEYSLAPESMYPVPVLECVAAYEYLINTLNIPGSKIILSGDSAGGALCLETLIRVYAPDILKDIGASRSNYAAEIPAGILLVSPLVSANTSSWLWQFGNDIITPELASRVLKEYLNLPEATNTDDLHLLKLALISKDFDRFVPKNVMVYVGEQEVMRDDILTLAHTVKQDKTCNVYIRKEDCLHDWYFIRELVKAQDKHILTSSDEEFVAFATRSLSEAAEHTESPSVSSTTRLDTLAKTLLVGKQSQSRSVHIKPEIETKVISVSPIIA
ncbi:Alpha/Beta hydrolase protein [Parasitella parasitica]|nr:Alpha/Beta hydrolase protein [Parasitella parasitica]